MVEVSANAEAALKSHHQRYLRQSRDRVLAALDGLSEFDVRRPMTVSGTNLLGLVKHLAGVEVGYLSESVGRPSGIVLPWDEDGSVWENGDMWARADESREWIVDLYRRAWAASDASIAALPLDAPAEPAWWPEERRRTTFGHLLVRVVDETARHAGHCDILREVIAGHRGPGADDLGDDGWWDAYLVQVQAAADAHRAPGAETGPPCSHASAVSQALRPVPFTEG